MIDELKRRICNVWDESATDLPQIHKAMKQFLPRLEAVDGKRGGSVKTVWIDINEQVYLQHFMII